MLVRQPQPVLPVLLDMKVITVEDVLHAVLEITLSSMVTHASLVLVANIQTQHQVLARPVQAIVRLALL